MIVWGGYDGSIDLNTGGRYCTQAGSPTIALDAGKRKMGGINTVRLTWNGRLRPTSMFTATVR